MRYILAIFVFLSTAAFGATYYVAANGLDTNNGTSTTTAWLHAPGMPNCSNTCGSTTLQPGDSVIFRGGDTWHFLNSGAAPYTGGTWTIPTSGTATTCQLNPSAGAVTKTTCIYIGTNHTYFSGGSYSRPILSLDGTISTTRPSTCAHDTSSFTAVELGSKNYVIFDDFEISAACWQGSPFSGAVDSSGTGVEISNLYFHGWELGTTSGVDDTYSMLSGSMPKASYIRCDHNVFDNSDGTLGNTGGTGFAISNTCKEIDHNFFNHVSNGCICNPNTVHDNTIQFLYEPVTTQHGNIIESNTGVAATGTLYAYNNLVHDFTVNGWWLEPVDANEYFFNNIDYNDNGLGGCFLIDGQTDAVAVTLFAHNDTWDSSCTIRFYAQHTGSQFKGTGDFEDNHYIGQSANCIGTCTSQIAGTYSVDSGATFTLANNGSHVVQTNTTATGQGYVTGNNYAPTTAGNSTVGAGANLTSFCSGIPDSQAAAACTSATSAGVGEVSGEGGLIVSVPAIPINLRPSSGAWDAGAYEFASATQATQPSCSPGTGTYSSTQTVSCTNPNSGTTVMCYSTSTTPVTNGAGTACTTGTKYTAAISVSASETLKIIAGTSTLTDSSVASYTYTITASFALTVTSTDPSGGSASGVVTSSPAGISCPPTCSANFASGSNVTLTPVAASGSLFINWSTCSFSGTCVVTMSAAESVTANFCQPIAPNFCLNQTAQSTSFSIASNIVTINASNTFPSGAYVGLSQFTTGTQLTGRVLKTNGSSTTTQLVGTLYNAQNTALTESNVSTTADTTGYLQGQGWNPFYTAPFPAPNSGSTCVPGNGDPSCVLPIPATGWGPNTWAFDLAVPSGGVYGAAPTNPMVMLSDTSTAAGHGSFLPSLAGETNERNISLPDGSTPPNYMFALNQGGHLNVFSGHIDPTHCAGVPCFVSDVFTTTSPATTGVSNSWSIPQINYGIFSQLPANRPGPHQALRYTLNMVPTCGISGSPDCSIAPVLQSYVLQYSFGLPNCAAGVGCVTAAAPTNIYPLNTCPDYAHLFVGKGLGVATQIQMDDFDNNILIGVGGAGQGNLGNHSVFVISMATSPPKCTTFDTAGTTGTNLGFLNDTTGHDGTGYAVNDTFSFTEAGGVCPSTGKVTAISGGGGTGPVSTIAIVSGAASGCYLARGFATTTTSGSGSGLEVDVTFVGTYGSFATTWAPIASASCPAGNNTTLSCESSTTTAVTAFGLHNCSEQADGVYLGCSGSGPPPPPNPSCVGTCDFVDWQIGTTTFIYPSNSNLNGHGARGFAWSGNASNPNLWESKLPTGTDDANCTNPADCYKLFTLPNGGCASAPGGVQMHGTQPTIFNDDSEPYYVTSSINSPGVPTQVNPPGFTCAVGQQSFFTVAKPTIPGTNLGVPSWFDHWYENTNNAVANASNAFNPHTENFEGFDNIMSCSPDGVWCMGATDMNTGFAGNTGLGVDPLAAFVGTFSVMVPQGIISPTMVLFRGGILQ